MSPNNKNTLVVITGPTAVGKTQTAIEIAQTLSTEIISADARQFYKELKIGTATPSSKELAIIPHHFIGHLSVADYYNASKFEFQALELLEKLFKNHQYVLITGGSGLYIDALCDGIDDMPDADDTIREKIKVLFNEQGIEGLRIQLKKIDPEYYEQVDLANPNRIIRGLEVYYGTGKKFSEYRKNQKKNRPFNIKKIILNRPRAEVNERINHRTDLMVKDGIIEEALSFYKYKHHNALNTVGYKELFLWIANQWDLPTAIEKIKTNTRRYAKRQVTWFKKYPDAKWISPDQQKEIIEFIKS